MRQHFPPKRNFKTLSMRDLLDARDAYHIQLANLENVIATAIGLYRIRSDDPDAHQPLLQQKLQRRHESPVRTLQNTIVQPWSWPCVLVFVNQWQTQQQLTDIDPDQVVPRFLYLGDGRVVPTCVLLVEEQQQALPPLRNMNFPHELLGGGYPLVTDVQNHEHIGSVGCIVSDGSAVYALTNKHVTGVPGNPIYAVLDGQRQRIGTSCEQQVGKKPFEEVYPGWPGTRSYVNLDAALVHLDDLDSWTAQVFGLGELGNPINLHPDTITLDLIGCPVCAFGAASGKMYGEIQALFYRYKSVGGFDYVSDLLIGSGSGQPPLNTMPGDSGTIWCFDTVPEKPAKRKARSHIQENVAHMRPLALQWGGHVVRGDQGESRLQFALASCLSTVCQELDVDIVPNWNTGHREYWGEVGHYKIAASACDLVDTPNLQRLLSSNKDTIAYGDTTLVNGAFRHNGHGQMVPLADVADLVWRKTRPQDAANHFADMDQVGQAEFAGQSLLDLCKDARNLDIDTWNRFYNSLGVEDKRGSLPFRVWQIYDEMVQYLKQQDVVRFVCAAGVLAHYVGDASQPLHVSYLHHGHPDNPAEKPVHSKYETDMLDRYTAELVAGVNQKLEHAQHYATVHGGKQAAMAIVNMMRRSLEALPPEEIITAYDTGHQMGRGFLDYMWQQLGDRTEERLTDGALCLASIWESAWQEGGGDQNIAADQLGEIDYADLLQCYSQSGFAPSYRLTDQKFAEELLAVSV